MKREYEFRGSELGTDLSLMMRKNPQNWCYGMIHIGVALIVFYMKTIRVFIIEHKAIVTLGEGG